LNDNNSFLNTVITGPPGTGKTEVANIIARIYKSLGYLETDRVTKADRSDLVGMWLGSTAIKTKDLLESAKGGVLFIDEAY
jgi:SpoVK/Ycf46/Vps4 family AAA+-type ATPase